MIGLESDRNDHYSSFNDIVTMPTLVFNHHIAVFVFNDRINHNKITNWILLDCHNAYLDKLWHWMDLTTCGALPITLMIMIIIVDNYCHN